MDYFGRMATECGVKKKEGNETTKSDETQDNQGREHQAERRTIDRL